MIEFWLGWAPTLINPNRWTDKVDLGTSLFVAHNIAIAARNMKAAAAGGAPGMLSGPLQSKAVGAVSATYDTMAGTEPGAGWYALTSYGNQLFGMMQIIGMGGLQIGVAVPGGPPALGVWNDGGPPGWV